MKVATYNVWFGDHSLALRGQALCDILAEKSPDVIALQEGTPAFARLLLQAPWTSEYALSIRSPEDIDGYENILLSRLPGSRFERVKLWSYQDRYIHLLRTDAGDTMATVHLESRRQNQEIRQTQLSDIFSELGSELTLLMGDFNFDAGSREEEEIPPHFVDVWKTLYPHREGYTCDTQVNGMAAAQAGRHKQVRYDRIFTKRSHWTPKQMEILGTSALASDPELWPSDHFGLLATLTNKSFT